ncbi:ADP-ribosylglycohydrolase family protein [Nocardia asteroides]|uniref:ADP-ribosylglycohydrolase family protein n=1 Tax=Nocardia asteroides TaxID=1824 RepID=UPI001E28D0A9|nr:ADP-ribosylglycohydrolase family protein [Nocardia asteroides]UGT62853.1 ADP-ribosylglycohydrolase family protein [Nocardia asteroides]
MLWSAWADALGWISELTSAENLHRRTKGRPLTEPFAWQRQIGGRNGVRVDLPAGCYSDDTQLRLATARAISRHGFDVEAFARVELPVWLSYALGGGRSTKAAAASMNRQNANWSTNFYKGWEQAGGNGAAMRIQPHVFAEPNPLSFAQLDDVVRNSVVTHGHPNAIVGAVLHATVLSIALAEERVPQPADWSDILDVTSSAIESFRRLPELAAYWKPRWEEASNESFEIAWERTIGSAQQAFQETHEIFKELQASASDRSATLRYYDELVRLLELDQGSTRGSGLLTAVASTLLAAAFPQHPADAARLAASRLDTDTDTIATMAAAIVAAANPAKLVSPVLDAEYITSEADRLTNIALERPADMFPYPDLLHWTAPKSAMDSVGIADGHLALAGLGWVEPFGVEYSSRGGMWRWMTVSFGPTMLLKFRNEPPTFERSNWPNTSRVWVNNDPMRAFRANEESQEELSVVEPIAYSSVPDSEIRVTDSSMELDVIFRWLEQKQYSDSSVGYALRRILERGSAAQLSRFIAEITQIVRFP